MVEVSSFFNSVSTEVGFVGIEKDCHSQELVGKDALHGMQLPFFSYNCIFLQATLLW